MVFQRLIIPIDHIFPIQQAVILLRLEILQFIVNPEVKPIGIERIILMAILLDYSPDLEDHFLRGEFLRHFLGLPSSRRAVPRLIIPGRLQ